MTIRNVTSDPRETWHRVRCFPSGARRFDSNRFCGINHDNDQQNPDTETRGACKLIGGSRPEIKGNLDLRFFVLCWKLELSILSVNDDCSDSATAVVKTLNGAVSHQRQPFQGLDSRIG
jgi:hypothetical protein